MNAIRTVASGKRHRYQEDGYDLDLCYVTPRLIAMGYPAAGVESMIRNPMKEVQKFLQERHGEQFLVVNVSERPYPHSAFGGRVVEQGWPDHHSPPFETLWVILNCMHQFLTADPERVVVVHCQAGKGRTGVVIAAYLIFCGLLLWNKDLPRPPTQQQVAGSAGACASDSEGGDDLDSQLGGEEDEKEKAAPLFPPSQAAAAASADGAAAGVTEAPLSPVASDRTPLAAALAGGRASPKRKRPLVPPDRATAAATADRYLAQASGTMGDLQGAHEMAVAALEYFKHRRGDGVTYMAQHRSVEHCSRVVVAAARRVATRKWMQRQAVRPADASAPGAAAVAAGAAGAADDGGGARMADTRLEAAEVLQELSRAAPDDSPRLRLTHLFINNVPTLLSGLRPYVVVTPTPYQFQGEHDVIYNSAWTTGFAALPLITQKGEFVQYKLRSVEVTGDVTVRLMHHVGSVGGKALADFEVCRFTFHTSFLESEPTPGIFRVTRGGLDTEGRKHTIKRIPQDMYVDCIFADVDDSGYSLLTKAVGHATDDSTPPTRLPQLPPGFSVTAAEGDVELERRFAGSSGASPESGRSRTPSVGSVASAGRSPATAAASLAELEATGRLKSKRGFLRKVGGFIPSWRRRWFVLHDRQLKYYKSQSDPMPAGIVPLSQCTMIDPDPKRFATG